VVERATGEMVGSDRVRPIDYMRASVIDDEFFNQSAIKTTPRSSCRPALKKRLTPQTLLEMDETSPFRTSADPGNCPRCPLFVHLPKHSQI
jgi:hypothetical protein